MGMPKLATLLTSSWLSSLPWWAQIAVCVFGVIALQWALWLVFRRVAASDRTPAAQPLVSKTARPAALIAMLLGLGAGLSLAAETTDVTVWTGESTRSFWAAMLVLSISWFFIGVINGADDMILARYRIDVKDNLRARRLHTQVQVIARMLTVIIGIIGLGIALMQFDQIERIGASLLASAGVAGIVIGFAARPVLGNIIAGVQIALTQPIRLDDAVVISGEWGWIEEITTTYVVVKIWDQRRLIVPFSKIIEEPFQNWTRKTSQILGTVELFTDYTVPMEPLREELKRLCESNDKWDGRVCLLQTTDATERTVKLRALVSAEDSPSAWDLRCAVREGLIAYLQREHPTALPREREQKFGYENPSTDPA